jgi:thiamine biosynthesis lipoprotein
MGTRVEMHRFGAGDDDGLSRARAAIVAVDDALTIHRPSAATAMNDALLAGQPAAIDDPILFEALAQIDAAHALTCGLFDPVADVRHTAGWPQLRFDKAAARITCDAPVALDFGGMGKGLALDRAVAALRSAGVDCALLSAGDSSIAVVGAHPLGGAWPFAIPDPRHAGATLVDVELLDEALSVSATIGAGAAAPERAAMIRPGAGAIATPRCAVAVDRSASHAEMLSTALIVADGDARRRLADPRRRMLFDLAPDAPRRISE